MSVSYFNTANQLMRAGKLDEAIAAYRRAIELNPNFCWIHHNLGEALTKLGRWDEAVSAYRRAIELNPNSAWSYNNLGEVLARVDRLEEAATCFRRAIELNSDFSGFHTNLKQVLTKQANIYEVESSGTNPTQLQQEDEEILTFKHDLELYPDAAYLHHLLGHALAQRQRWNEAISCYRRAIELAPTSDSVYYHLGIAFAELQRWDEAAVYFQKALELNSGSSEYQQQLDYALQIPQLNEEIAFYRHKVEVEPDFQCYQVLGERLVKRGKVDEAIAAYQNAVKLQPDAAEIYLMLGSLLNQENRINDAIAAYQNAVRLQADTAETYFILGNLLANEGQIDEAIKVYKKAIEKEPTIVKYYCNLVWILSQLNQWDEATCFYSQVENNIQAQTVASHFQKTTQYKFIRFFSLTEADRVHLNKLGLSETFIKDIMRDDIEQEQTYINSFANYSDIKLVPLGLPAFHHSMLETGYIYSLCPVSGKVLRSNQSFFVFVNSTWQINFYRFTSEGELFYLMVGCLNQFKLGIYFPLKETVILFIDYTDLAFNLIDESVFKLCVDELKSYSVNFFKDVKHYIFNENPKEIANVIGFIPNIGHYFWDDVPPLQTLCETDKINKLSKVIIGTDSYISLKEMFSELPPEKFIESVIVSQEPSQEHGLFKTILKGNYLALRLSQEPSAYIKNTIKNRLYNFSKTKCSEAFLQKVEESQQYFPLLWITIRTHNRSWVSQVEGIANIINSLCKCFPNLGVIFDGLPTEAGNLEKILSLLDSPVKTYSGLDCTVYETIVWVHQADLFVMPFGAGQIFPTLANKIVVYHSHREWTPFDLSWIALGEKEVPFVQIQKDYIRNVCDASYGNAFSRNYECDWQAIYNEVIKIVEEMRKS